MTTDARLWRRWMASIVVCLAMLLVVLGLVVLSQAGMHAGHFPLLFIAFLLMGAGMGTASVPQLTIAMSEVPPADAGLASGIVTVSTQVSRALGVAVLGTISADHTRGLSSAGGPLAAALTAGYHLAFVVAAGCVGAGIWSRCRCCVRGQRRLGASVAARFEPSGETAAG